MPKYAASKLVEVYPQNVACHEESFVNWATWWGTLTTDGDIGTFDTGVYSKAIVPFVSTGKQITARCTGVATGNIRVGLIRGMVWDWYHVFVAAGRATVALVAGRTYDGLCVDKAVAGTASLDYIIVNEVGCVEAQCTVAEVVSRNEVEEMSEATIIAEYETALEYCNRAHIKIWMSGGQTDTLTKEFTGIVHEVRWPRHQSMHRTIALLAKSYMLYMADRETKINFKNDPQTIGSAIHSVLQPLINESLVSMNGVVTMGGWVEEEFDRTLTYDVLRQLVENVDACMYMKGTDLQIFQWGTQDASESLLSSDVYDYERVDDTTPGVLINSVTVLGDWSGFFPSSEITLLSVARWHGVGAWIDEQCTNSDLVEASANEYWRYYGGALIPADCLVQSPHIIGNSALSLVWQGPGAVEFMSVYRSFGQVVPGEETIDLTLYPYMYMYWWWNVPVSVIEIRLKTGVVQPYYWTRIKPLVGTSFYSNRWGGDNLIDTAITEIPVGPNALDEEGKPLYHPEGIGDLDWRKIRAIEIQWWWGAFHDRADGYLDGVYFGGFQWLSGARDESSIASYGEVARTFETAASSRRGCASIAESILEMHADPLVRLEGMSIVPNVTLKQCDEVRVLTSEIDARLVINEIRRVVDQATLTTTLEMGRAPPGYAKTERLQRERIRKIRNSISWFEQTRRSVNRRNAGRTYLK